MAPILSILNVKLNRSLYKWPIFIITGMLFY